MSSIKALKKQVRKCILFLQGDLSSLSGPRGLLVGIFNEEFEALSL